MEIDVTIITSPLRVQGKTKYWNAQARMPNGDTLKARGDTPAKAKQNLRSMIEGSFWAGVLVEG